MNKLIIALAALAVSGAAVAGPKWTYVDVGYVTADAGNESTNGYAIRGSYGFADVWHAGAGYSAIDFAGGSGKVGGEDADGYNIYVGVNPALTDDIDFVADLGWQSTEVTINSGQKLDSDQIFVRAGPRAMITDAFEIHTYVSLGWGSADNVSPPGTDSDKSDVAVELGGAYYFTPNWSLGLDVSLESDNVADLYVRWSL